MQSVSDESEAAAPPRDDESFTLSNYEARLVGAWSDGVSPNGVRWGSEHERSECSGVFVSEANERLVRRA